MRSKLALLALFSATACSHDAGQDFDANAAKNIAVGSATKAQVAQLLGEPYQRQISSGGQEIWVYTYAEGSWSPTSKFFIPYAGPFMKDSMRGSIQSKAVQVTFSGDIATDCIYRFRETGGSGRSMNVILDTAPGAGAGTTGELKCSEMP
jgi:outer membrane protein assembly factor BamE (lipoprotein component of BamABCDE complex)